MINKTIAVVGRFVPASLYAHLHIFLKQGYWPNLRNPQTFSELLINQNLYYRDALVAYTADKYHLRDYVRSRLGGAYLPETYAVIDDTTQIAGLSLPQRYVVKGSHGSGWVKLVENGEVTLPELQSIVEQWLSKSYYWQRREWVYATLKPRVLFEENLSVSGTPPADYKIYTFNGKPRMILQMANRFKGLTRNYFDENWQPLSVMARGHSHGPVPPRPKNLSELLQVASVLAEPFPFARVDLYNLPAGRIIVGEITHFPGSGVIRFIPATFDRELGEVWRHDRPISSKYYRHSK